MKIELFLSHEDRSLLRLFMALTDDLKAAVAGLDSSVQALVGRVAAQPPANSVPDAAVQAAIADVLVQTAAVNAIDPAPVAVPVPVVAPAAPAA